MKLIIFVFALAAVSFSSASTCPPTLTFQMRGALNTARKSISETGQLVLDLVRTFPNTGNLQVLLNQALADITPLLDEIGQDIESNKLDLNGTIPERVNKILNILGMAYDKLKIQLELSNPGVLETYPFSMTRKAEGIYVKVVAILVPLLYQTDNIKLQNAWGDISQIRIETLFCLEQVKFRAIRWVNGQDFGTYIEGLQASYVILFDNVFKDLFQNKLTSEKKKNYVQQYRDFSTKGWEDLKDKFTVAYMAGGYYLHVDLMREAYQDYFDTAKIDFKRILPTQ